ncbi:MAG: hypothetical protein QXR53_04810 [Candidatus Norongarragalinales archaeon]
MAKCVFCGKDIALGTGFVFVKKTGQSLNFCSRKCQRNLLMGRNPKNYRWASGV